MNVPRTLFPHRFSFYAQLSEEGRARLARRGVVRVRARERLLAPGQDAGGAFFVTSGRLRVYYLSDAGREATLYHVAAGQACVLSLAMTLAASPFPAWAEAGPLGASLVRVPGSDFSRLLESEAAFRGFVFSSLAGRIMDLLQRLEELGTARIEARLARLLLEASGPLSTFDGREMQDIAAELGTAREVVSRLLKGYERSGAIQIFRGRLELRDESRLRRLA